MVAKQREAEKEWKRKHSISFLERLKSDGSLFTLQGILIGILICSLIGLIFGFIKVSFFEQTSSGKYAVHEICIKEDLACLKNCDDNYDPTSHSSCQCPCLESKTIATPLGKRLAEVMKMYAVIAGGVGITIGAVIGEEIKKRKRL